MIHVATSPYAHIAFDLLAWGSALALGVVLHRWRLRQASVRLASAAGPGYFAALAVGAVIGAWAAGSLNTELDIRPALSHSIVGALVGGIVAIEIYKALRGIRGSTGGSFVGPFALGAVIGRFGCLFTGLPDRTYGTPTNLPWAVDLSDGIGRHPVQLYESLAMAVFLAIYLFALQWRASWAMQRGFYALCITYGAQRFVWEWLKPYPRVLGPLNVFHILSVGLVIYGFGYWRADLQRARRAQERAVPVPRPDDEPV